MKEFDMMGHGKPASAGGKASKTPPGIGKSVGSKGGGFGKGAKSGGFGKIKSMNMGKSGKMGKC